MHLKIFQNFTIGRDSKMLQVFEHSFFVFTSKDLINYNLSIFSSFLKPPWIHPWEKWGIRFFFFFFLEKILDLLWYRSQWRVNFSVSFSNSALFRCATRDGLTSNTSSIAPENGWGSVLSLELCFFYSLPRKVGFEGTRLWNLGFKGTSHQSGS